MNQAFVFIKPHANTRAVQDLVSSTLISKGFVITSEGELTGKFERSPEISNIH